MKLPVQKQTIDMQTGAVTKTETVNFQIMPPRAGLCKECATKHDPEQPHNAQSLLYQYTFFGANGRWPSWADAMAHCTDQVRDVWTQELVKHGVDIN